MYKRALILSTAAISLLIPTAAFAAADSDSTETQLGPKYEKFRNDAVKAQQADGEALVGGSGPVERASGGLSYSSLQFSTEQGETEATLSLAFNLDTHEPRKRANDGFVTVSAIRATIQATAPIGKDKSVSKLFQGDSLVDGTKLKFALHRTAASLGEGRGHTIFLRTAYTQCVSEISDDWVAAQHGDGESRQAADKFKDEFGQKLADAGDDSGQIALRNLAADANNQVAKFVFDHCQPGTGNVDKIGNAAELVGKYTDSLVAFKRTFFDRKPLSFMGIDGSLGRNSYSALDRIAFKKNDVSKTSWEVGAYYGLIAPDISWSARARIVYGKSYASPDEVQICRAITGAANQECLTGPDGLPASQKTGLASVEFRRLFKLNDNTKIAIAPQVTYRFKDKDFGVEVPLYLAPDKDGKLSGGLKFAYSSKKDASGRKGDFGIGLFVGVPFSVFF